MKKLFCIIALLTLAGCSPFHSRNEYVEGFFTSYEIGKTTITNTGSVMVSSCDRARRFYVFEPNFTQELPLVKDAPLGVIAPGQIWHAKYALDSDKNKYILTSDIIDNENMGIIVNPAGEVEDERPIITNIRRPFFISAFRDQFVRHPFINLKDKKLFTSKDYVEKNGQFCIELIYNGIMNNVITLTYREFVMDFARPAFYQEMKYDLNTNNAIMFRTIKMNILDANNLTIDFQVVEDGGLPWVHRP